MPGGVDGAATVQNIAFLFYTQWGSFLFQKDFKISEFFIKWKRLERGHINPLTGRTSSAGSKGQHQEIMTVFPIPLQGGNDFF